MFHSFLHPDARLSLYYSNGCVNNVCLFLCMSFLVPGFGILRGAEILVQEWLRPGSQLRNVLPSAGGNGKGIQVNKNHS